MSSTPPTRSPTDHRTTRPNQHPPAGVHSLWRLRGYLRPHLPALAVMLLTALAGVGLSIAIPLVTKAIIDGPITDHEIGPLLPLGALALALGVLEALVTGYVSSSLKDAVAFLVLIGVLFFRPNGLFGSYAT